METLFKFCIITFTSYLCKCICQVFRKANPLEDLGKFTRAEPKIRSRAIANTAESSQYPSLPDITSSALVEQEIVPSSPESIPGLKIGVDDNTSIIGPNDFTTPLSEPDDDIHVKQESPDPPVLEFDIQIQQE